MNQPLARRPSDSLTTMTEYVLPTHANVHGGVFGGQILAWVDLCAAICAERHSGSNVVTGGMDDISFERPIKVGQVVRLSGRVTAVFRSSIEIRVDVEGEDAITGETWPCVEAFVTFVAVDAALKPVVVRPLLLETEEDRALAEAASARRAHRLARRRSSK